VISTYAELVAAGQNWLNRTDTDIQARIPEFITLAEAEMKRVLRQNVARAALSLSAAEVTLAASIGDVQTIRLNTGTQSRDTPLDPRTLDELLWLRVRLAPTGVPRYFAQVGNKILLAPAPDATYTAEIVYVQPFTALSSSDSSTWTLLLSSPDLYLAGLLREAGPYLEHTTYEFWDGKFRIAGDQINEERDRREAELLNQPVRLPRVFG